MKCQLLLRLKSLASVLLLTSTSSASFAQTVMVSPDITIQFSDGTVVSDEAVVDTTPGMTNLVDLGPLPSGVEVAGYHAIADAIFFSVDTAVTLPSGASSMFFESRDIVKFAEGDYSLAFDGSSLGIPSGISIDAVTQIDDKFVMSFDTAVDLGGAFAQDEDLVMADSGGLSLFLDASTFGVAAALDLDAAHVLNATGIVVSFDGPGKVGDLPFADEDAVVLDAGDWEPYLLGLDIDDDFAAGDLNAIFVPATTTTSFVFGDGFESGSTSNWSSTSP